jgi:hypothetical protein
MASCWDGSVWKQESIDAEPHLHRNLEKVASHGDVLMIGTHLEHMSPPFAELPTLVSTWQLCSAKSRHPQLVAVYLAHR